MYAPVHQPLEVGMASIEQTERWVRVVERLCEVLCSSLVPLFLFRWIRLLLSGQRHARARNESLRSRDCSMARWPRFKTAAWQRSGSYRHALKRSDFLRRSLGKRIAALYQTDQRISKREENREPNRYSPGSRMMQRIDQTIGNTR